MPLDRVKTQVLILHSEQRILDELSACVDDRFGVHCATTGTEALQTLDQTPIHVLITAQELPGMTGIDALREAKKRSPETVGILLDGRDDPNLEALVGAKEVFQILRGTVSSDDLNQLIDDATQHVRLLTATEPANDAAAHPDEPDTEHIVMETADNGSTVISDGSGTWSAFEPGAASSDAAAEPDNVEILVFSKDEAFLATVQESSRGVHNIRYASTPTEADSAFAQFPIGVAIVDAAITGSKVEELTRQLREGNDRLVCIVAGRRDDGEMLMDLINRGKVYRFLLKPVSPGRARLAIEASVKHHREAPQSAFKMTGSFPARQPDGSANDARARPDPAADPGPADSDADPAASDTAQLNDTQSGRAAARSAASTDHGPGTGHEVAAAVSQDDTRHTATATVPKFLAAGVIMVSAAIAGGIYFFTDADTTRATVQRAAERSAPADRAAITEVPALPASVPGTHVEDLLTAAENSVLEGRFGDAMAAVDEARAIDPDNARLPFLSTQIASMRLRRNIDNARAAIRESRFADASAELRAAGALGVADRSEIDAVIGELLAAQTEQRTDDLLDRAAASIDADKLLAPSNDNARHYYQLVLASDPGNTAAEQGLKAIAAKLALRARNLSDERRFDEAEALLDQARALDAAGGEIEASTRALAEARSQVATESRAPDAARRATAERAAAATMPEQDVPAAAVETAATAASGPPESAGPPGGREPDAAANPPDDGAPAATGEASDAPPPEAGQTSADRPVPVSSLTQLKYVAPKYPRSATRRRLSGWVDIVFTVAADGTTRDIEILDSSPGDLFVESASRAVEKWEFEPVSVDGEFIEQRAGIRLMFAFEQ